MEGEWILQIYKYIMQHNIQLIFASVLGLACRLTEPAHRPRPIKNIRSDGGEWEVNRTEIKIERKLGSGNFGIVFKGIST